MNPQKSASERREAAATTISNSISFAPPTDTSFDDQWHLDNPVNGLLDLNVLTAWDDYTGEGVRVFVLDDGFDRLHSDLSPNYNASIDLDLEGGDNDPAPVFTADNHGTACMGLIGAARNGTGAVGVAYDAELVGIRGYSDDAASSGTLDDYAMNLGIGMLHAANNGGDVLSMSNGYSSGSRYFNNGLNATIIANTVDDIIEAASIGRGGLGLNMVKAAGNSRADLWDTNMSAVDNRAEIISVAAVNQNGFVSEYSSFGAAILVSGFGSPTAGEVVTTDRTGGPGYTTGDITTSFNGTSAATPMVAGVVALILEANEALGWRDVQDILASSAVTVGSGFFGNGPAGSERYTWLTNGSERWNGGGMHFSNDYGFGLVDATAAVRLAETWFVGGQTARTSANQDTVSSDMLNGSLAIPDSNPTGAVVSGAFAGGANFQIEYTTITITMSPGHTFMGDLEIRLTSSSGVVSILQDNTGGGVNFPGTWTFMTRAFRGEYASGTWSVTVVDSAAVDTGTLTDVVVQHHGQAAETDDVHVFTNQYSDFSSVAGRTAVTDTNGGTDTINAAAVTSASMINLTTGAASQIDGVTLSISSSFENAIGGDGNDTLTGNDRSNVLHGGRGNDTLRGEGGNDTLFGGSSTDVLAGNDGADDVRAGSGADRVFGGAGNDTLRGESGLDEINGDAGADVLSGSTGHDTLRGGDDNDTLYGGDNNDLLAGNDGADDLRGGNGNDRGFGGEGNDTLRGEAGADELGGDNGDDVLSGSAGDDTLRGGNNNDDLFGGDDDDLLSGNNGNDSLSGGAGLDTLVGGAGQDTLSGGADADVFVFSGISDSPHGSTRDTITDFQDGLDRIDLSGFAGTLTFVGSAFTGGANQVRYDSAIGRLYIDVDGGGASDFSINITTTPTITGADLIL